MDANSTSFRNPWSDLFRQASEAQPVPPGRHFVDDDGLLDRWQHGELPDEEHRQLVDHLADCSYCREVLAAMLKDGLFTPAQHTGESLERDLPPAAATRRARAIRFPQWVTTALALAAGLAILAFFWPRGDVAVQEIAQADLELQRGHAAAALLRLEKVLGGNLTEAAQQRAKSLFEAAGYNVARQALEQGQFSHVSDVETRVGQLAERSARLVNLRLQAERGVAQETTLADAGSLTDYGYQLNGQAYAKSAIPVLDPTTERWRSELRQAVEAFPDEPRLRLNYGQFLLTVHQWDAAREQFVKANELDPRSLLALLGAGLADFEQQQFDTALQQFQAALASDPDHFEANLNTAMCLERLGRDSEALSYWQQAERLAKDPQWQSRIQAYRSRRGEN